MRFGWGLKRDLRRGVVLSCEAFDGKWGVVADRAWAVGQIQGMGLWLVPTLELVERLRSCFEGESVLELGAGRGYLSAALARAGLSVRAIDDGSWVRQDRTPMPPYFPVERQTAADSLRQLKPACVLCAWPPPQNTFESQVFMTPSVQVYVAIVSKHRLASGDWDAYRTQKDFDCTLVPDLDAALRPIEADQQLLLFRRRRRSG